MIDGWGGDTELIWYSTNDVNTKFETGKYYVFTMTSNTKYNDEDIYDFNFKKARIKSAEMTEHYGIGQIEEACVAE